MVIHYRIFAGSGDLVIMKATPKNRFTHELLTPLHQILGMAYLIHYEPNGEIKDGYYNILMASGSSLEEKILKMAESIENGVLDLRG